MAPRIDQAVDAALFEAAAAQQLGTPPQAQPPAGPAAAAPAAAPNPAADPRADNPPSPTEQVTAAISPKTEGDASREEAFIEVVHADGTKEVLSASQVAGLKARYRDLNYKQMNTKPLEPAIGLLQSIMEGASKDGKTLSGDDLAQFLEAAIRGYASNPTLGQKDRAPDTPQGGNANIDAELAAWERENAVSLPPLYKNMASTLSQLQGDNDQLKQMLTTLLNEARGITTDAAQLAQQTGQTQSQAYQQTIANNLNVAQARLQLPDEAANDFFDFAFARGYTLEDFIDPDLTSQVMTDFKAVQATPEMERLRALNARRQAFTGAASSSPNAPLSAGSNSDPNQQLIDNMAAAAMKKRGLA
jgi:hypothetical protein